MSQKIIKLNNRSKKYSANAALIQKAYKNANSEVLSPEVAIKTLMSLEQPKFKDGVSLEIHFKLGINPTKSDQFVRASTVLPHGTGKKLVVAAFVNPENIEAAKAAGADIVGSEDLVEEIKKSGKVNFDKAIAEPDMMKKLPSIARILGTAGVMPNPKTGTVGTNIEEMIKVIKAGKVDFKNDKTANIHFLVGKLNNEFTAEKLLENVQIAIDSVQKAKPEVVKKKFVLSAYLCTAQSPSIRII